MRAGSFRQVNESMHDGTMTGDVELLHGRRIGGVFSRIGGNGRRGNDLLAGGDKGGESKDEGEEEAHVVGLWRLARAL